MTGLTEAEQGVPAKPILKPEPEFEWRPFINPFLKDEMPDGWQQLAPSRWKRMDGPEVLMDLANTNWDQVKGRWEDIEPKWYVATLSTRGVIEYLKDKGGVRVRRWKNPAHAMLAINVVKPFTEERMDLGTIAEDNDRD